MSRRLAASEMYPAGETRVRSQYVELANGLRVRTVQSGRDDAPPVVLIPGWGCSAWIFHETLAPLADSGFRAIAVDLKGHGLSDKPRDPSEYTVDAMRDHLLAILDALRLEQVGLVGHSMGGAIAAHAAAVSPDRITGLVMVAPVGFAGVRGMTLFRALTPRFAIAILPWLTRRTLIRIMLQVVYGSLRRPTERDIDEFWAPTRFPDFTRALRHLLHEFDWKSDFPRLRIPRLTIVGSKDVLSPPSDLARYADEATRAGTLIVEGSGHVMFDEAPETVNHALAAFFGGGSRARYISLQNE